METSIHAIGQQVCLIYSPAGPVSVVGPVRDLQSKLSIKLRLRYPIEKNNTNATAMWYGV